MAFELNNKFGSSVSCRIKTSPNPIKLTLEKKDLLI